MLDMNFFVYASSREHVFDIKEKDVLFNTIYAFIWPTNSLVHIFEVVPMKNIGNSPSKNEKKIDRDNDGCSIYNLKLTPLMY